MSDTPSPPGVSWIRRSERTGLCLWMLALTALSVPLLWSLHFGGARTDYASYMRIAARAAETGEYPPHFLYPLAVNVISVPLGADDGRHLASLVLAALAVFAKLLLTALLAKALAERAGHRMRPLELGGVLAAMFLVAPLPGWWPFPTVYWGNFTPTIWHNPTTILALPFSLAAFLSLVRPGSGDRAAFLGGLLLALSVLIKPSFALAYVPALGLAVLLGRLSLRRSVLHVTPALVGLGAELVLFAGGGYGLLVRPLEVWLNMTGNPAGALFVSLAFPAVFLVLLCAKVRDRSLLAFAWLLFGIALAQFLLLAEAPPRLHHANLYWGTVPALYLLFLVSLVELRSLSRGGHAPKPLLALVHAVLIGHVASGAWFYLQSYHATWERLREL